jgi:hypothetical protein
MAGLTPAPGAALPLNEYYADELRAEVRPGSKWSYSNHAFAVLGQVIEDVSGEPLTDYCRSHLFEPLGMRDTDLVLDRRLQPRMAQGYQLHRRRLVPVEYQDILVRAAGSAFSTAVDMGRYMVAILNDRSGALDAQIVQLALTPQFQLDPRLPGMGLGFVLDRIGRHRIAWHNGGWPGFGASMVLAPGDGIGVVLLANRLTFALDGVAWRLMGMLIDPRPNTPAAMKSVFHENLGLQRLATRTGMSAEPLDEVSDTPPGHVWHERDIGGTYAPTPGFTTNLPIWMHFGGEVEVVVRGRQVELRSLLGAFGPRLKLARVTPADPWLYRIDRDVPPWHVVFSRDRNGRVDRLLMGFSELHRRPAHRSLRFRLCLTLFAIIVVSRWVRQYRQRLDILHEAGSYARR